MSGVGEASLVLGLISSIIAIFEATQDIYEAASDAKGLPRQFRAAAAQIPLVYHALGLAEKNINAKIVSEETLQSVKPVLGRCKERAASLKDVFDKNLPGKDASTTERYKRAMGLKMKSKQVKEHMEEIVKSMELLAQNQVFEDAETLEGIKTAIEQLSMLDEREQPHFVHSGTGAINANAGKGTQNNYNNSGPGTQYNAEKQIFMRDQVGIQYNIHGDSLPITQKLPYAKGATFNSYDQEHTLCHPATRVDLLQQIQDWAQQPSSKSIFWLNGMAGTGKSTISWTLSQWLTDQGHLNAIDLGASFFFKRGEGHRGNASRFFSTITRGLLVKVKGLDTLVAKVIDSDPTIFDKALGEQFDKLIYQPVQKLQLSPQGRPTLVVVVDALDECEKERDIKVILDLWPQLSSISNVPLKLFLTSRPELPIQLGFKRMNTDAYQEMILQDAVSRTTVQRDISTYLTAEFSRIREEFNSHQPFGMALGYDWPGDQALQDLTDMAVPLFIVAATICRFVGDFRLNPRRRLENILEQRMIGMRSQMEQTYLPVLQQMVATAGDRSDFELLCQQFRMIVGSIVVLAEPLSISSLSELLKLPQDDLWAYLSSLHSVFCISADFETPIRILHLSFREFLLSEKLQRQPFGVDGPVTHRMLLTKCLELLSRCDGLRENLCDLQYPGQRRQDVDSATISQRFSPAFEYTCRYWVHHAEQSKVQIHDDDEVHLFLQTHFLHWLEALSLISRIAEVIGHIGVLQSIVSANNSQHLSSFLEDGRRFVLANRYLAELAPLQIYSSAIVFAPQQSIVRKTCGQIPAWIQKCPITAANWSLELQTLEGHSDLVNVVAFSPDGSLLASGSKDGTVRLWNAATGQEMQRLDGHTDSVSGVAFSPDGSLLASASGYNDGTVRLWKVATGQEVQKLEGHTGFVGVVAFSADGSLLASVFWCTVRLWKVLTGQEVQRLEGHIHSICAVAFSPDGSLLALRSHSDMIMLWKVATSQEVQELQAHNNSFYSTAIHAVAFSPDGSLLASASQLGGRTVRLWKVATGQEVQKLKGHVGCVYGVAFSPDGSLLASASGDRTVRLWKVATGQEVQKLEGHTDPVSWVAFSPDGSLLASASDDRTVRLWKVVTVQEVQKLEGHAGSIYGVAFSPDGSLLASASGDHTIRLWKVATGQEVQKLEGHTDSVNAVAFSPDGSLLASRSGYWDHTVRLWKVATGQEVQMLKGHTCSVEVVAFSPNGLLLVSGSDDGMVRLWKVATGKKMQKLKGHTDSVCAVAFSPDGSLLASASGYGDRTVRLWKVATGQEVHKLEGHTGFVDVVAFSPDGSLLASASRDSTVRLWKVAIGQEIQRLKGHGGSIDAVAFSPDGSLLASASNDGTIRLWKVVTGQEVQKFETILRVRHIHLTTNSSAIITNRGAIRIHNDIGSGLVTQSLANKTCIIQNDWIRQNNRDLLWLPQEYRSAISAFHGDTFAFGLNSGQVRFIQFGHA